MTNAIAAPVTTDLAADLQKLFADNSKRVIGKTELRHRELRPDDAFVSCKAEPTAPGGSIEGYGSVWNVVDYQGEIVRKGAFAKTIAERGMKLPLQIVHFAKGGDIMATVGAIVGLEEDDHGLKFKAHWLGDDQSQAVRSKVIELMKADIRVGASIGYRVINYGYIKDEQTGKTFVELRECALEEITVTLRPANAAASITSAKDADSLDALVAACKPLVDADRSKLTREQKDALLAKTFGDRAKAGTLGKALMGIAEATIGLLSDETPGAKTAGEKAPANAKADQTVADATKAATAADKAGQHSAKQQLDKMRLYVMKLDSRAE
jgi:HK97 family phage prohead protease